MRARIGVLAGVLTGTLLAIAGPASSAKADVLPYVPWSSYLPGWTDEYIPSSDNDCVAGRDNCLRGTLKEQSRIADETAASCSHNAIFSRAYVRMTQLYGHTRELPGYYQDVPYFNHVDAVFARYYTDAYYAWKAGERAAVPQAWLTAFDAARDKRVTGQGDLLLGMNAHINRDLPYVMAAVGLVAPDGSTRKADYDAVEEWLAESTTALIAELAARFDPSMDDASDPLGLGNSTVFQLVSAWRENAWRNAELLVTAPTPEARALVAENIEAQANLAALGILTTMSYVPLLSSTGPRDTYCAAHKGDAPPVAYAFGAAEPWGYAS